MQETLRFRFDTARSFGPIKTLNGTNGGPRYKRYSRDQLCSNFEDYRVLELPYSRNHDSFYLAIYGGPYSHDITAIFPRFEADENDPASYDFACTDESILATLDAGTKTFFRLGQSIEPQIKKHGTLPPPDFHKWARICEHVIRHYTEGWADGFQLDMPYWEIWCEPDLDADDSKNKRCWGGTEAQFHDLYEIAAKHLKACFPHLKIGGPSLSGKLPWAERFLADMSARKVPIDFFSWHSYASAPEFFAEKAVKIRDLLLKYGYRQTENIMNEYNYVRGWEEDFVYSLQSVQGLKGASYVISALATAQNSPIDMMMYYDSRPSSGFNGLFDFCTQKPLKAYYSLYWFAQMKKCDHEIRSENREKNIYILAGTKDGKVNAMLTYYSEDDDAAEKTVELDFGKGRRFRVYVLDREHDAEILYEGEELRFTLPVHTGLFVTEI